MMHASIDLRSALQINVCTGVERRDHFNSVIRSRPRRIHSLVCRCTAEEPPKTYTQAAIEARTALRRFREASRTPLPTNTATVAPCRIIVQLPLPSPSQKDDLIRNYDEGEWPGGIQQRFRSLRPLIETMLEGYSPEFVGMLESPADGIGVWRALDGAATVVANVSNATFSPFARLCAGDFGSRVTEPEHILVAVNPSWTVAAEIGQLWQGKLRAQAAELIDDPNAWENVYYLEDVRTGAGATGLLYRAFPGEWRLFATNDEDPPQADKVVLEAVKRPSRKDMVQVLNEAAAERKAAVKASRKGGGWWNNF